jgi:uncharacterized protein YkwD
MRRFAALFVVAVFAGCYAEGGISDPVVTDEPWTYEAEDTGTPTTTDDTGTPTTEDTGTTPTEDSYAPPMDTGTTTTDTGTKPPADTSVAMDTGTVVTDTGTAVTDTGTPVTDTGTSGGWPTMNADLEAQILVETNKRRAAGASCGTKGTFGAAGPLVMHPLLQSAARKHSKDMATNNYFSHTNLAGLSPFDRMRAEGYKGGTMGENIAAGNATVAATMDQWMKSDGHCANIMSKSYTQLGVGYWYSATSTYRHYWTQNFGAGG